MHKVEEASSTSVEVLIDSAPRTLVRTESPEILLPHIFDGARRMSFYDLREKSELALKLKEMAKASKIKVVNVSARDIMTLALRTPKHFRENYGTWFTDLPGEIVDLLTDMRFGRPSKTRYDAFEERNTFRRRANDNWGKEVCSSAVAGNLWEFGIVIKGSDETVKTISVSVPWDKSHQAWFKRLTPERIFVGRREILDTFSRMVTGKTVDGLQAEKIFTADDLDVWWGQAVSQNPILKGRDWEIEPKLRPSFAERVLNRLEPNLKTREFFEFLKNAPFVTGYFIDAFENPDTGEIEKSLHITDDNWIGKTKPFSKRKEEGKCPDKNIWHEGMGGLYNSSGLEKAKEDFSVYIDLATLFPGKDAEKGLTGSVGVESIQIQHDILIGESRGFIYYFNNSIYGDAYARLGKYNSIDEKSVRPLGKEQILRCLRLFERAKERGKVDSKTLYVSHKQEGLSERTKVILANTEQLLKDKLAQVSR